MAWIDDGSARTSATLLIAPQRLHGRAGPGQRFNITSNATLALAFSNNIIFFKR